LRGGLVVSQGQDRTFTTDSPPPPPPVPAADTVAPVVKITKAPKKKMKTKKAKARVKVRFASEPGARFTCKIDSKKYKACTSPAKFKVKAAKGKRAKHRVLVVATDAAGNASVPALVRFRVIRK
jgi:hypothetical protein